VFNRSPANTQVNRELPFRSQLTESVQAPYMGPPAYSYTAKARCQDRAVESQLRLTARSSASVMPRRQGPT